MPGKMPTWGVASTLPPAVRALLERPDGVLEPAYWRNIFGLSPRVAPSKDGEGAGHPAQRRGALNDEGYIHISGCAPSDVLAAARDAVRQVVAAGWPPVFALLSDAMWDVLTAAVLTDALRDVLSEGTTLRPGIWVKHVAPGERGWPPHVDVLAPDGDAADGHPRCLTGWLALTDVGVASSCIHIVTPRLRDEAVAFAQGDDVRSADFLALLHHARAVPVAAGGLLLWRRDVLHWGGAHHGGGGARISVAFEVGHAEMSTGYDVGRGLPLGVRPDFAGRGRLIAHNVCVYGADKRREPELGPFVPWAKLLLASG